MIRILNNSLYRFDLSLILYVSQWGGRRLITAFFYWLSRLGDGHVYVLYGLTNIVFLGEQGRISFMLITVAFLIDLPVYFTVKKLVKRSRPFHTISGIENLIAPPDQYSFPSGHTSAAFIMAFLAGHQIPELKIAFLSIALLIGLSRIYLRVHYPTDVAAGMVLGLVSARLAIAVVL